MIMEKQQTAVEWFAKELNNWRIKEFGEDSIIGIPQEVFDQAKAMEKKQLFLASKTSAKEAYEAGQQSMYCGCYDISGCTSYKEWLYEQFKSE